MKFIKKLLLTILLVAVLAVGVITYMGYQMYVQATQETSIAQKIKQIRADPNYIEIDQISKDFQNAIIAVEDHRFREHNGIDLITTARSMLENIKEKEIVAGGSSISQQLGRLLYFTQEKRFTRKVAELFVAFDLEKNYSKDEILELYSNTIYYGDGYYGIKEASNGYLEKEPNALTLSEASMLAGLPNAPSAYSPTKNLTLTHKRQTAVLNAMAKYEYITQEQRDAVINTF